MIDKLYYARISIARNSCKIETEELAVKETSKSYKFLKDRFFRKIVKKTELEKVRIPTLNHITDNQPVIIYSILFKDKEDETKMIELLRSTAKERIELLLEGARSLEIDW